MQLLGIENIWARENIIDWFDEITGFPISFSNFLIMSKVCISVQDITIASASAVLALIASSYTLSSPSARCSTALRGLDGSARETTSKHASDRNLHAKSLSSAT